MAAVAALSAYTNSSHIKGNVVNYDQQIFGTQLIEVQRLDDSLTAVVHERGWLHQKTVPSADHRITGQRLEAQLLHLHIQAFRQCVQRHEAHVVPCILILRSGIAEPADYEIHSTRRSFCRTLFIQLFG